MSSEGPTTVGSIDARLTLNADDFERGMTRAGEQADRLDGRRVNVDVHANTAAAIAGLRELELAENRLKIAQLNLEDVNSKAGATEQARLRAQNALITAEDRYDRALSARQQAVRDATEAERAAAAATDATASATDRDTSSTDRNTDAKKAQFNGIQALLAAAPLLFAGTTELAAAATGMGVAFTAMGLAGAAAVKGIKEEMQQGTAAGEIYGNGLSLLKGDLDQISQTAAVAMVASFDKAVGDVNQKMPFLNQLTGEMAAELGKIGGGLLSDVLNGLRNMQPLIEAGAQSLGDFVGWLGHFTNEDGFHQFVAYGVQTLPQVIGFLEDVVTLAGRLIAAFAPLGPVVIGALDGIVSVLNALPLPVLSGLVTAALTMPAAFSVAKVAVATFGQTAALQALNVSLFGASINLAVPVVGILVAALAGLTLGIAAAASSQQQATVAASEYADALERDNNLIGQNVTALAVKKLAEDGAYDAVSKLGLGQDVLTKAVLGNSDALKIVQGAIDGANDAYSRAAANSKASGLKITESVKDQKAAADLLGPALNQNLQAIQRQQHINELAAAATKDSSQATRDKAAADQQGAAVLGVTTQAYQTATTAQAAADQKTRDTTLAMQLQNDAAGILKASLDALNGKALSAAQAQNAFDSSLANMGTHVDKVGKQIHFTTNNIDDMSAASVALRGQLNSQVANLQQVVEANGGLSNSTGQARAQMETMRQQIIDNAVAHGVDRDAVTAYIDKILQIPASVPPTKIDADTAAAESKIATLQMQIDAMHGRVIEMSVHYSETGASPGTHSGGASMVPQAYGGPVQYRAGGGGLSPWYARGTDTVPTVLTPGEFVVKASSASSVGPAALEYINRHGQLPPTGGGEPQIVQPIVHVYVGGEAIDPRMVRIAQQQIGAAVRDAAAMRPGIG